MACTAFSTVCLPSVHRLQVFRELTKMVLKTKRDTSAATGGAGSSGTIKIQKSTDKNKKCAC